jgi:hypothetical protein
LRTSVAVLDWANFWISTFTPVITAAQDTGTRQRAGAMIAMTGRAAGGGYWK